MVAAGKGVRDVNGWRWRVIIVHMSEWKKILREIEGVDVSPEVSRDLLIFLLIEDINVM